MNKAMGFILAGMAAGFASGITMPLVLGIRGAIFGGVLAIGALACRASHKSKGYLAVWITLVVAVVVALVTSLSVEGWQIVIDRLGIETTTSLSNGTFVDICLISFPIAWGLFLCYRSFLLRQSWWLKCLFFFGMPFLSTIPRAVLFYSPDGELPVDIPLIVPFCLLFGVNPFLVLWGGVAWWFGFVRKEAHEESQVESERQESPTAG